MRLIAKATADNVASIDWALPAGFTAFRIVADGYFPATDGSGLRAQVSTDGGSNYADSGYVNPFFLANNGYHSHYDGGATAGIFLGAIGRNTAAAKSGVSDGLLTGAAAGLIPRYVGRGVCHTTDGNMYSVETAAEYAANTDRVTHLRLKATTGNITSGVFYLYGEWGRSRLLAKTVVDNTASFDWALPPGFARYRIEVQGYKPAVDQAQAAFLVSTDGGSNFATTSYTFAIMWAVTTTHGGGGGAAASMQLCPFGQANDAGAQTLIATLYGAEAGMYPRVMAHGVGRNTSGVITLGNAVAEYAGSTDRVTHIRLMATSGNMTAGTFYLYGEQ